MTNTGTVTPSYQWRLALTRSCCTGLYVNAFNVPLGTTTGQVIYHNDECLEVYAIGAFSDPTYDFLTIDYVDCDACELVNPCPTPTPTTSPTNTSTPTNTPTNTQTPTNTPTNTQTATNTSTPTRTVTPSMQWRLALIRDCCTQSGSIPINVPLGSVVGNVVFYNGNCEEVYAIAGAQAPSYPNLSIDYVDCDACEVSNPCPSPTPTSSQTNTPTNTPTNTVTPSNTVTPTPTTTVTPSATLAAPVTGTTTLTPDADITTNNISLVGRGVASIAAALTDSFDGTYGQTTNGATVQFYKASLTNGSVPAGATIDKLEVELRSSGAGGTQPSPQTCTISILDGSTTVDSDTFSANFGSSTIIDQTFVLSSGSLSDTDIPNLDITFDIRRKSPALGTYRFIKCSVIVFYTE